MGDLFYSVLRGMALQMSMTLIIPCPSVEHVRKLHQPEYHWQSREQRWHLKRPGIFF